MSRCFPFPLPAYEKKTRLDDVNLVIKAKHKQKKHKRDGEKKGRNERKEKEKSDKDKEGDRKNEKKHRDKKHKKKDKNKSSEEKKNGGSFENQNSETLVPDTKPNDDIHDSTILFELEKRLRNDEGTVDIRTGQKIETVNQSKINLLEKFGRHIDSHVAGEYDDFREKRELSRMDNLQCLKVDSRGLENGFVKNFSGQTERNVQNKVEGISSKFDSFDPKKVEKEKNKHIIGGKGDRKKPEEHDKDRKSEDKKRKEKKESVNEPINQRGSNDSFHEANIHTEESREFPNLPIRKEPQLNGFLHDDRIWPNNMSGPLRKSAPTSNRKVNDNGLTSKPVNRNVASVEPGQILDYLSDRGTVTTNNHLGVNNVFIASPLVGIETSTEQDSTANDSVKVKQRVINNHKLPSLQPWNEHEKKGTHPKFDKMAVQGQDEKTNIDGSHLRKSGILEATEPHICSKPSSLSLKVKEKLDKPRKVKPPHPDLKYLDQILAVPKVECPQFDDQEWLFGHREPPAKRPRLTSNQSGTTTEVWAGAMRLESADVIALPYVIPY